MPPSLIASHDNDSSSHLSSMVIEYAERLGAAHDRWYNFKYEHIKAEALSHSKMFTVKEAMKSQSLYWNAKSWVF